MRTQATDSLHSWPVDLEPKNGILVLSGYGLDIRVWRGRLKVEDGIGITRRNGLVHRATGRLRRLVVLGHTGSITLDAIRWLADAGAGYLQIDSDGRMLAAFGPMGGDRPGLRRMQAQAIDTSLGNDIARRLIADKLAAQAETLTSQLADGDGRDMALQTLESAKSRLRLSVDRDDIRLAEAIAAAAYWTALAGSPVRFARRDSSRISGHWLTLGSRTSPLTGGPRLAANPANALLNYLYALLEGEATLAARLIGLDPGLGVLHADQSSRDSLAADLMEPVRPLVDRYVLRLIAQRTFAARDFFETRQGVCRITPSLARELAITIGDWRSMVGRVAEDVARSLDRLETAGRPVPTPVSGRNRSAGRGASRRVRASQTPPMVRRSCAWCGGPVTSGRRTCSADCMDAIETENRPAFVRVGTAALGRLRASGWSPTLSPAGRARLGNNSDNGVSKAREWQRTHDWPTDLDRFVREIRPRLRNVTAPALASSTGLSVGYCRRIQKGEVVPHPMWWDAVEALAQRTTDGG